MKIARRTSSDAVTPPPAPVLTVNIDIDPVVEVVRRHVKLSAQVTRSIRGDLVRLLQTAAVSGRPAQASAPKPAAAHDPALSTQAAADLVGVSRPYLVARIEAGDIPLHQQVGKQRRVLQSAVLAWHRREQSRCRKALGQLGADLDREIFPG